MKSISPVIVLEFNELCPSLLDRFMREDRLPGFSRLYEESQVFTTVAQERAPHLDPWIQWTTVHSGVNFDEHGVELLGDGYKFEKPRVWDLLSREGLTSWICGSMNVNYQTPINGYVLPDPWTVNPPAFPAEYFSSYFKFVRNNVLEHTSGRVALSKVDYARFLSFMVGHGLSFATVRAIIKQLAIERTGKHRWKRAMILDRLQADVFCSIYRQVQPDFATFFLNSTAHMQHCYWRNMQPELFEVKPTAKEQAEFDSAVIFGYQQMDQLVTRFMRLLGDDATIVMCTALSQQPCLIYEQSGGKTGYRPRDFKRLLAFAGVESKCQINPVMSEEFQLIFASDADAEAAEQKLFKLNIDGTQVMRLKRNASQLSGGCGIFRLVPDHAQVRVDGTPTSADFEQLFYQSFGMKSGMHHPDGALWIRTPRKAHRVHTESVPLDSVAPTLLSFFDLPKAPFMSGSALDLSEQTNHREPIAVAG